MGDLIFTRIDVQNVRYSWSFEIVVELEDCCIGRIDCQRAGMLVEQETADGAIEDLR